MKHAPIVAATWVVSGLILGGAILAWWTAVPSISLSAGPGTVAARQANHDTVDLAIAESLVRIHNPFRFDRRPATARYNPWEPSPSVVGPMPPAPIRPSLALAGVLGGPPWLALVEGLPGRSGPVVLALGDEISGVRFAALRQDTAVVTGFDTTWTLTPRRTWQ